MVVRHHMRRALVGVGLLAVGLVGSPVPTADAPTYDAPPRAIAEASAGDAVDGEAHGSDAHGRAHEGAEDLTVTHTGGARTVVVSGHVARIGTARSVAARASTSAGYKLTYANVSGRRTLIRWNPCRTITFRINPAGAPRGAVADVRTAFTVAGRATGNTFAYRGGTSWVPTRANTLGRSVRQPADIVVAWAAPGRAPGRSDLLPGGKVLGMGGVRYSWGTTSKGARRPAQVDAGFVVLDATKTRWYRPGFGKGLHAGGLYLHELGHALALNHVSARGQAMYPSLSASQPAYYGSGDAAGLRSIGRQAGCVR